ncbi:predicted protein [Histoplasma capsulatum H143]|uniref:Uncharacterized protein n=1 Tax=Ajellomyces capsulatus (strain H143) TaxID=544712 RepID=C6HI80_AJECH|nr:predicted protein [Histoplasma capsulatum H143]
MKNNSRTRSSDCFSVWFLSTNHSSARHMDVPGLPVFRADDSTGQEPHSWRGIYAKTLHGSNFVSHKVLELASCCPSRQTAIRAEYGLKTISRGFGCSGHSGKQRFDS